MPWPGLGVKRFLDYAAVMKRKLLLLLFALSATLGVVLLAPARAPSLRFADPDRVAELELAMWQAYYAKQKLQLFTLLVSALRLQYGYSRLEATEEGFYLTRAAAHFGDLRGNYDAEVLPDLVRGYSLLQRATGAAFDPEKVARAELAWWVARRDPRANGADNVGRLIGEEYLALYGPSCAREDAMRAGLLRAQAGKLRDAGGAGADWPRVGALLHESYRALARALAL